MRYRYDAKYRPTTSLPRAAAVLEIFRQALDEAIGESILLRAGDVLLVDNRRMLHGRTALSGKVRRRMLRMSFTPA